MIEESFGREKARKLILKENSGKKAKSAKSSVNQVKKISEKVNLLADRKMKSN